MPTRSVRRSRSLPLFLLSSSRRRLFLDRERGNQIAPINKVGSGNLVRARERDGTGKTGIRAKGGPVSPPPRASRCTLYLASADFCRPLARPAFLSHREIYAVSPITLISIVASSPPCRTFILCIVVRARSTRSMIKADRVRCQYFSKNNQFARTSDRRIVILRK